MGGLQHFVFLSKQFEDDSILYVSTHLQTRSHVKGASPFIQAMLLTYRQPANLHNSIRFHIHYRAAPITCSFYKLKPVVALLSSLQNEPILAIYDSIIHTYVI